MTGTRRGQLVDVNEESLVRVTGIIWQHAVVHELLRAVALVARSQRATRCLWVLTRLQACSLRVVVHVIDDHTPLTLDVTSPFGHSVGYVAWANIALGTCRETILFIWARDASCFPKTKFKICNNFLYHKFKYQIISSNSITLWLF